jgi:hypothetical protein
VQEENQRLKSDLYRVRSELTALRGNATDDDVGASLSWSLSSTARVVCGLKVTATSARWGVLSGDRKSVV